MEAKNAAIPPADVKSINGSDLLKLKPALTKELKNCSIGRTSNISVLSFKFTTKFK